MAITFVCKSCEATLEVDGELAGRPVACGHCQAEQKVPGPAPFTIPVVRAITPSPSLLEEVDADDPPYRPRGLSPVVKIALVLAVLMGLLAAGAVAFTVANPGGWTPLKPKGAGFEIDMPGRVNPNPRTKTVTALFKPVQVVSHLSERKRLGQVVESAEVSYADLPAAPDPAGIPPLLSIFANQKKEEPGYVEIERRTGTLGGKPSLIVLIEVNGRDRIVYQLTIKDKRFFSLAIAGKGFTIDHARVKKFFESFHFTND